MKRFFSFKPCRIASLLLGALFFGPVISLSFDPRARIGSFRKFTVLAAKPSVEIEYCTGCRWLLRSAYYAQELLTTFEQDLEKVSLKPNSDKPGGKFVISVDGEVIWDRKNEATAGFPETKVLKQIVRDKISPSKDLGHSDSKTSNAVIEIKAD